MAQAGETKRAPAALDYDLLPELVGYQLRLAQIATFRDFAETLNGFDITPSLFGTLVMIGANPGLKQSELAQAIQLDRSTVVTVIDKLERRGLVARRRAPADRRSNALQLTNAGEALLGRLKPLVLAHEARLAAGLGAEEKQQLVRLLGKVFPARR